MLVWIGHGKRDLIIIASHFIPEDILAILQFMILRKIISVTQYKLPTATFEEIDGHLKKCS